MFCVFSLKPHNVIEGFRARYQPETRHCGDLFTSDRELQTCGLPVIMTECIRSLAVNVRCRFIAVIAAHGHWRSLFIQIYG